MKNFLTKLLAMTLAICALFTLTACGDTGAGGGGGGDEPAHVHDYIDHVCSCGDVEQYTEGLRYKEISNGVTILGFEEGAEVPETVYIPQKINGKKVIAIGGSAFENSTFRQIVLPEGLEVIYSNAFTNSMLNAITFPASLKQIYPNAFDTKNLGSAIFLNTNGWYVTRHAPTSKPASGVKDDEYFASKTALADRLTNCDTSNQGNPKPGACFWTRFE